MRIRQVITIALGLGTFFLALAVGRHLARLPQLAPHKLLALIASSYALVGLIILTEFVVKNARLQEIMVSWVSSLLGWLHVAATYGIMLGIANAGHPNSERSEWVYPVLVAVSAPILWLLEKIERPKGGDRTALSRRHQQLGMLFLVAAGLLQIVASVIDLLA